METQITKELSYGEEIFNNNQIRLEELYERTYRVRFPEKTILRVRKFATELAPAYKGSLWGSKRWIRKWGVEIYDPQDEKKYKTTFRECDKKSDCVFEFEITSEKLFEHKSELKKFLKTLPLSPFVAEHLQHYEKKNKPTAPRKKNTIKLDIAVGNEFSYEYEGKEVCGKISDIEGDILTFDTKQGTTLSYSKEEFQNLSNIKNTYRIPEIGLDYQILFDRPNSIIVCRIIEIREKAVKVDYAIEPISSNNQCIVYNHTCWIPKSVLIAEEHGGIAVKKWFANNWEGGYKIKPYYLENGKKIEVKF